jgi:hypothetical protein
MCHDFQSMDLCYRGEQGLGRAHAPLLSVVPRDASRSSKPLGRKLSCEKSNFR